MDGPDTQTAMYSPEPTYIMTFEELQQSQSAIKAKELQDKNTFNGFVNPDILELRSKLLQWASSGFQEGFVLYSISVPTPDVCSDGVKRRNVYEYKQYLTNTDITTEINSLQSKLPGMMLSTSLTGNTLALHVFKA